jgi:hypothetical protein
MEVENYDKVAIWMCLAICFPTRLPVEVKALCHVQDPRAVTRTCSQGDSECSAAQQGHSFCAPKPALLAECLKVNSASFTVANPSKTKYLSTFKVSQPLIWPSLLQATTGKCEEHLVGPVPSPSSANRDTAYRTSPDRSHRERNEGVKWRVSGVLRNLAATRNISAGWQLWYPDRTERRLTERFCKAVMCILSFYKYLIHVWYSLLTMEVKHATVFVLPKTLLFVHLSNSLCNVTLEGLINVKVCLVPILRNFHVCSINEYFTLEKYVFVAMTKKWWYNSFIQK